MSQGEDEYLDWWRGYREPYAIKYGKPWTPEEDRLIREAARANDERGIKAGTREYAARLRKVAFRLHRTYAAVRKRASRIGAASYRPRVSIDDPL